MWQWKRKEEVQRKPFLTWQSKVKTTITIIKKQPRREAECGESRVIDGSANGCLCGSLDHGFLRRTAPYSTYKYILLEERAPSFLKLTAIAAPIWLGVTMMPVSCWNWCAPLPAACIAMSKSPPPPPPPPPPPTPRPPTLSPSRSTKLAALNATTSPLASVTTHRWVSGRYESAMPFCPFSSGRPSMPWIRTRLPTNPDIFLYLTGNLSLGKLKKQSFFFFFSIWLNQGSMLANHNLEVVLFSQQVGVLMMVCGLHSSHVSQLCVLLDIVV